MNASARSLPSLHLPLLAVATLGFAPSTISAAELARAPVYTVVDLDFHGPEQTARDAPARDVELSVRIRHERGEPEYRLWGFWDGDGRGGSSGRSFKVRFCPTEPGRWTIVEAKSNAAELEGQHRGDTIVATPAPNRGFWLVDEAAPGRRWYRRSNGAHDYVFGNTLYSFLSETYVEGRPNGSDIASDVGRNAAFFKKICFSAIGDLYPHPTEAPFLDDDGKPTPNGDYSHRPNPRWFQQRTDLAVKTALSHDVVADLILSGVDQPTTRAALRAGRNGGDPGPFLRYMVARYGAFPNVWFCLINEYDIRTPRYSAAEIVALGRRTQALLAYPNPLSVHRASGAWPGELNSSPAWNDHVIFQRKLRKLHEAADALRAAHIAGGASQPVVNDELAYEGAGDGYSEADVIESHLGAFLGGGYATTGYKASRGERDPRATDFDRPAGQPGRTAAKLGQYFAGNFDPAQHTAADNLAWLRAIIDREIAFWKMAPDESAFANLAPTFRGLAGAGHELVLGTNQPHAGMIARLAPGRWRVEQHDVMAKTTTTLAAEANGEFTFASPASRAVLFHFKRL